MKTSQKLISGSVFATFFFMLSRVFAQTNSIPVPPLPANLQENIISAAFQQIYNNPASLSVIGTLCVFAWLMDDLPFINSRYVAHFSVLIGGSIYWLFAGTSSVPKTYPYPFVVLVNNGLGCGFIAFAIHRQVICRVINAVRIRGGDSAPDTKPTQLKPVPPS